MIYTVMACSRPILLGVTRSTEACPAGDKARSAVLQTEGHVCSLQIRQHWARASKEGHMHVGHLAHA